MTIRTIATHEGEEIREGVLESAEARISVMSFGAVIRDWRVSAGGREIPVVLGFESFDPYPEHSKSFGIIAGRVANRTAFGRFTLDGEPYQLDLNHGGHHLHGGSKGLGVRNWAMEPDGDGLILSYASPDGEMGYPGHVAFRARFALDGARLVLEMEGDPDRPTPINLAQHNYYNLDGEGEVFDHHLWIAGGRYTPTDDALIPTGEIASVAGTVFDFREEARIGARDPGRAGADGNVVLDAGRDLAAPAATLRSDVTGLGLRLWTAEPAVQLFTAGTMDIAPLGHDGARMAPFCGVCLEAQHFPNSVNQPDWPSIIATPDAPYRQRLEVEIAPL